MNFEEWFSKNYFCEDEYYESDKNESEKAWIACKEEVLKILKTKDYFIGSGIKSAIREIESL